MDCNKIIKLISELKSELDKFDYSNSLLNNSYDLNMVMNLRLYMDIVNERFTNLQSLRNFSYVNISENIYRNNIENSIQNNLVRFNNKRSSDDIIINHDSQKRARVNSYYKTYTWYLKRYNYLEEDIIAKNDFIHTPKNFNEIKRLKFYFSSRYEEKRLYRFWIFRKYITYMCNDGSLYYFDDDNNLVPVIIKNVKHLWGWQ